LDQYLLDLSCPFNSSNSNALLWLLGHAISLEYEEKAGEVNQESMLLLEQSAETEEMREKDQYNAALALAGKLDLLHDMEGLSTLEILTKIRDVVKSRVEGGVDVEKPKKVYELNKQAFPLGFDTGDAMFNKGATILRMLYIDDLRQLQDEVNAVIITVQEQTANPRTNSKLGKVGY
jgi:RLL motif-containing protein 1